MMVVSMLLIVQNSRSFLTAVTPTAVAPTVVNKKKGSSENDGISDVYDPLKFKVLSNCCYPNYCHTD